MIPKQKIERGQYWTDSLTLVSGCSAVSEGCAHCWSAGMASRFPWGKPYAKNGKWTGRVEPNRKAFEKLEKRAASTRNLKPRVYQIWNDLFHENLPPGYLLVCLEAMIDCPSDIFLVLTKRPFRLHELNWLISDLDDAPNIYIGVSVESQKHIHRIDQLIQNWPGKKFVSIEPCLGAVDLSPEQLAELDQVIIGCESGAGRRQPPPMKDLLTMTSQCEDAGVSVFVKQWIDIDGKLVKMPEFDGHHWDQLAWSKTLTQEVPKGDTG